MFQKCRNHLKILALDRLYEEVTYLGPMKIRHHRTKFSHRGDLAQDTCAFLQKTIIECVVNTFFFSPNQYLASYALDTSRKARSMWSTVNLSDFNHKWYASTSPNKTFQYPIRSVVLESFMRQTGGTNLTSILMGYKRAWKHAQIHNSFIWSTILKWLLSCSTLTLMSVDNSILVDRSVWYKK